MSNVRQELFDISLNHLREQGEPSYDGVPSACAYRSEKGLQCAAAPFILEYSSDMEGSAWDDLVGNSDLVSRLDPRAVNESELVQRFQEIHDKSAEDSEVVEEWSHGDRSYKADKRRFMELVEYRFRALAEETDDVEYTQA